MSKGIFSQLSEVNILCFGYSSLEDCNLCYANISKLWRNIAFWSHMMLIDTLYSNVLNCIPWIVFNYVITIILKLLLCQFKFMIRMSKLILFFIFWPFCYSSLRNKKLVEIPIWSSHDEQIRLESLEDIGKQTFVFVHVNMLNDLNHSNDELLMKVRLELVLTNTSDFITSIFWYCHWAIALANVFFINCWVYIKLVNAISFTALWFNIKILHVLNIIQHFFLGQINVIEVWLSVPQFFS